MAVSSCLKETFWHSKLVLLVQIPYVRRQWCIIFCCHVITMSIYQGTLLLLELYSPFFQQQAAALISFWQIHSPNDSTQSEGFVNVLIVRPSCHLSLSSHSVVGCLVLMIYFLVVDAEYDDFAADVRLVFLFVFVLIDYKACVDCSPNAPIVD